jgi:hypothetical protein
MLALCDWARPGFGRWLALFCGQGISLTWDDLALVGKRCWQQAGEEEAEPTLVWESSRYVHGSVGHGAQSGLALAMVGARRARMSGVTCR